MGYDFEKRKLSFQLVPKPLWKAELKDIILNWNEISVKTRSVGKCSICDNIFSDLRDLHAHEVWKYDDITHIQSLENIIPVCTKCHNTIHIGRTAIHGNKDEAFEWYLTVNQIDHETMMNDYEISSRVWKERSNFEWKKESNLAEKIEWLMGVKCTFIYNNIPIDGRYYLNVPFGEKDKAKSLGAKFEPNWKRWYYTKKEDKKLFLNWLSPLCK